VTTAGTARRRGGRQGEPHPPQRVLLVSRSAGLAALLSRLLDGPDRLGRAGSLRELADGRELDADAVVLDVPGQDRSAAVGLLRRRFRGPLVVLTAVGDHTSDPRPDDAYTLLARPFTAEQLAAALAVPVPGRPAAAGAARAAADPRAVARQAPVRQATPPPGAVDVVRRARQLLATVAQEWQTRRRVRVAGFSVLALVVFAVAFAVAAQDRCGPGCDLLGTGFSSLPTVAPGDSSPPTSGRRRVPATTAAAAGSAGTGGYQGITAAGRPETAAERRGTTTTRKLSSGGGGPEATAPPTRPPTTAPPTTTPPTTAPPTTAPPTTAPPTTTVP
jgi:hypothetical protein